MQLIIETDSFDFKPEALPLMHTLWTQKVKGLRSPLAWRAPPKDTRRQPGCLCYRLSEGCHSKKHLQQHFRKTLERDLSLYWAPWMERVTLRDTQRNNHPLGEAHLLQTAPRTQALPLGPPPRPPPVFALPQTPARGGWLACFLLPPPGKSYFLWSIVLALLMQVHLVILHSGLSSPPFLLKQH